MKKSTEKLQFACVLLTSFLALFWLAYLVYKVFSPAFMFDFIGIVIVIGMSAGIAFLWYLSSFRKSEQRKRTFQKICLTYIFLIYTLILLNLLFLGWTNSVNRRSYAGLDYGTWFQSGSSLIPLQTIIAWLGAKRWDLIIENLLLFLPFGIWEAVIVDGFIAKKIRMLIVPAVLLAVSLARFISHISGINIDQLLLWLIGASIGYIYGGKIKREMHFLPVKELEP